MFVKFLLIPVMHFNLYLLYIGSVLFRTWFIQAPNKSAGYLSRSGILSRQNHFVPGHLVPFFRPGHLVPRSGHLVQSFIMGFNSLMRFCFLFFVCQNLLFKSAIIQENDFDQMHIGKFYHLNCNTMPCRHFNSVNPMCLFVSHKLYTRINNNNIIIILQKNIK